jgi:3-keto-5-aminohexanoate cleavage enzyme
MGGNARTGLEDTLYIRKGELAPDNAALVSRLAEVCRSLERPASTVSQTEAILSLPGSAVRL